MRRASSAAHDCRFGPKSGCFRFDSSLKLPSAAMLRGRIGQRGRRISMRRQGILRHTMDDEPKSAAELREIRLNRKRAQDAEGIKAMADIAAADLAIRRRTANLRAMRLAKEAADRDNPPEPKIKARKSSRKKAT
jgi:hypothetical protein